MHSMEMPAECRILRESYSPPRTVVYSFLSALQVYDIPWILTGYDDMNAVGGPNQVILFPVMEMVRNVYLGGDSGLGRACAEGVVLMSVIMVITLIQFKVRKKKV